jgi:peptide/nickel transport system ATP-binding protein
MSDLHLEDLTIGYGSGRNATIVVERLSLFIGSGRALGLVGESGSGKSTVARAVAGLVPLTSGRVLLDGAPVVRPAGAPSPVQLVFQNPTASLDPQMTIGASIGEALPGRQRGGRAAVEVLRYLELVGLEPDHAARLPAMLSGGQRQRVAIARALAAEPRVLIGDEITSALDVSVQAAILNLIRDLQRRLGFTLLFISHNIAAVRYLCDEIAVMEGGRLVEAGSADAVIRSPMHPYTRRLIDAVPRLTPPAGDGSLLEEGTTC